MIPFFLFPPKVTYDQISELSLEINSAKAPLCDCFSCTKCCAWEIKQSKVTLLATGLSAPSRPDEGASEVVILGMLEAKRLERLVWGMKSARMRSELLCSDQVVFGNNTPSHPTSQVKAQAIEPPLQMVQPDQATLIAPPQPPLVQPSLTLLQ